MEADVDSVSPETIFGSDGDTIDIEGTASEANASSHWPGGFAPLVSFVMLAIVLLAQYQR